MEGADALHRAPPPADRAMVSFDDVVEVFHPTELPDGARPVREDAYDARLPFPSGDGEHGPGWSTPKKIRPRA
jgi:hypothetical protein